MLQLARDHAEWAQSVGTPAEFHLLNPAQPGNPVEGKDWIRVSRGDLDSAVGLERVLAGTQPGRGTPLAERLRQIREELPRITATLRPEQQQLHLVLVTDGEPSDGQQKMVAELRAIMSRYRVNLVVRLCTDDPGVKQFWNRLDAEVEFELDVIDDCWGEAAEVAEAGNGWLTYFPGLHRFREAGTVNRVFDAMDERRLTLPEAEPVIRAMVWVPGAAPLPPIAAAGGCEAFVVAAEDQSAAGRTVCDVHRARQAPTIQGLCFAMLPWGHAAKLVAAQKLDASRRAARSATETCATACATAGISKQHLLVFGVWLLWVLLGFTKLLQLAVIGGALCGLARRANQVSPATSLVIIGVGLTAVAGLLDRVLQLGVLGVLLWWYGGSMTIGAAAHRGAPPAVPVRPSTTVASPGPQGCAGNRLCDQWDTQACASVYPDLSTASVDSGRGSGGGGANSGPCEWWAASTGLLNFRSGAAADVSAVSRTGQI